MIPVHSKTFLKRCHSPLFSPVGCPRPQAKKRLAWLCVASEGNPETGAKWL